MNRFSRIGFVLAAAGSAVGLGNIWKFPYITGEYGGGAFVLVYLLAILFIGLTVFLAEAIIGQNGQADVSTSFIKLSKSKNQTWKFAGFMVFAGLIILSFYSVVLGWVLDYIITSFSALPTDTKTAGANFGNLISNDISSLLLYHTLIAGSVVFIVLKGIKEG
ncbi:MAG: sodium-dependent transporter, partial [Arcobacter sp.]